MKEALRQHWPEYLIEAWCLGVFMISACFFGVALFHPASPIVSAVGPALRGLFMGVAMGGTAVLLIRSAWGRRSGAHFNPAVTLTFLRLGKIAPADAFYYMAAQFAGGAAGVLLSWAVLGDLLADSSVNYVVTVPGSHGLMVAFAAEVAIAFILMSTVLFTSNSMRLSRFTPFFVGSLVAVYIAFEAPLSGMSMNPARTFASASVAGVWTGWWIYLTAPPFAMLAAAEVFVRTRGLHRVLCAKIDHSGTARCIFDCRYGVMAARSTGEEEISPRMNADDADQTRRISAKSA